MLKFIRTSRFKFGDNKWVNLVKEMRTLLNDHHPKGFSVYFGRTGQLGKIFWTTDFESLAAFESWQEEFGKKEDVMKQYMEISDRMNEFVIHGTTEDTFLSLLD